MGTTHTHPLNYYLIYCPVIMAVSLADTLSGNSSGKHDPQRRSKPTRAQREQRRRQIEAKRHPLDVEQEKRARRRGRGETSTSTIPAAVLGPVTRAASATGAPGLEF